MYPLNNIINNVIFRISHVHITVCECECVCACVCVLCVCCYILSTLYLSIYLTLHLLIIFVNMYNGPSTQALICFSFGPYHSHIYFVLYLSFVCFYG